MDKLPRNVWVLTIAQSLIMSVNSVVVFAGGLVGSKLAPLAKLATLPVASTVVGTAAAAVPVTLLMRKYGRKNTFTGILIYSILVSLLAGYAVQIHSFYLFCTSTFLFGATSACVMQFRFAAMESVSVDMIPKAASSVLLGGIAAAFIGPEVAVLAKDLVHVEFVGSFIALSILFVIGLIALRFFKNPEIAVSTDGGTIRPLSTIAKQPVFWLAISSAAVGYAIMTFIMTATPVSMHVMDGHSLDSTKWVIQSHIIAMFLPSLVAAQIMKYLGVKKMMILGLMAYLACVAIGYLNHELTNYWSSLILLGIGWNFLFIGGTTILPKSYNESERFKVQAINEFAVFGMQAIASLSAGWFIFALGWEILLLSTLPLILFQILLVIQLSKKS